MRSIVSEERVAATPPGLKWMAWAMFAMAALMIVYGALIASSRMAFTSAAWLIGIDAAQLGPTVFVVAAVAYTACGVGLLRRWKWARWLAILLFFAGLAQQVPTVSAAVAEFHWAALMREGFFFVARMVCVHYLFKEDVREVFERR